MFHRIKQKQKIELKEQYIKKVAAHWEEYLLPAFKLGKFGKFLSTHLAGMLHVAQTDSRHRHMGLIHRNWKLG